MRAVAVRDESQIAEARRTAVALGAGVGFTENDNGRVAIVATELSTNLIKHGGGGELLLSVVGGAEAPGVQCLALDKGPGIADVGAALRDGHSTAGTPGNGLGAVARQSQLFEVYSRRGQGTAVLARMYGGGGAWAGESETGAVHLAKPGEEACGDAWRVRSDANGLGLMVVDGLGHGPLAASAATSPRRCSRPPPRFRPA